MEMSDATLQLVQMLVVAVIGVLSATIMAGIKTLVSNLPKRLIPIITPIIGILIASVGQALGIEVSAYASPQTVAAVGTAGGLAGIGIREVYDKAKNPTPAAPTTNG